MASAAIVAGDDASRPFSPTFTIDTQPSKASLASSPQGKVFSSISNRFGSMRRTSWNKSSSDLASPPPPYSSAPVNQDSDDGIAANEKPSTPKTHSLIKTLTFTSPRSTPTTVPFPLEPREAPPDSPTSSSATDFSALPPLSRPIAIPRLTAGADMPFARAWAPILSTLDVSKPDFLAFLDMLNLLTSAHPAVTVLKLAALGCSFIPVDYADAIEGILEITAEGVQVVVSRARIKAFLFAANETFWHPRGVHARMMSTRRLKRRLGIRKKDRMVVPLSEEVVDLTTLERCVRGMEQWCCPLEVNPESLPASAVGARGRGVLERASAWRVRRKVKEENKAATRRRKRQMKRRARGKKVRGEFMEQGRLRWLDWIVLQRLDEYEVEKEDKDRRKAEKKEMGFKERVLSWRTVSSVDDGRVEREKEKEKGGGDGVIR